MKKGRGGWAFAVIAAAAVAGVSLLRPPLRRALWTATGAAGAPPSAAPAAPAAASASPPGARRVHVSLRADPPAARFFLDGAPLGTNPYEGEMATDEQAHALTVRADGFDPRALPVRLTADVDVVVALTPLGARGSLAASPPAPHRTLPSPVRTSHEVVPTRPTRAIDEDDPYSDNPYDSGR